MTFVIPPLNPSKVFSDPPFGFSVTTDPPLCYPKNQVIPPPPPPDYQAVNKTNNDRFISDFTIFQGFPVY